MDAVEYAMARMSQDQLDDFLSRPIVGVLATTRRSGEPYATPVSWAWFDGAFWLSGTEGRIWCQHLKERPVASLCIQTVEPHTAYVSADCEARFLSEGTYSGFWECTRRVIGRYISAGIGAEGAREVDAYIDRIRTTETRHLIELTPRSGANAFRSHDLSVYRSSHRDRGPSPRIEPQP